MTSRKLTVEQADTLELQTTQMYEAFVRAVQTKSPADILWQTKLSEALYQSLQEITHYDFHLTWRRDTQRTATFDRYVLQYALSYSAANNLRNNWSQPSPTDLQFNSVKKMLDSRNHRYLDIVRKVERLAYAHKFDDIVQLFDYVRVEYARPTN